MKKEFNTLEALAMAVGAFEQNQKRVIKLEIKHEDGSVTKSNRQLILESLNTRQESLELFSPDIQNIVEYLQHTALIQTLSNSKHDSFLYTVNELLTKPTVTERDFGILAWAPKLAFDLQIKDTAKQASSMYERTSRYIGKVGDKITINFTLIESKYIKSMNCYAIYGHTDTGSLVSYWVNDEKKIVKQGTLSARVKSHREDNYHNDARVTQINFVKAV